MYKKTWCTCKAVVFANKTYCFSWCTVTAKPSKTNGCFLLLRKTLLAHFVFCRQSLLCYVIWCLHPSETPRNYQTNKKKSQQKPGALQKRKLRSPIFFPFSLNTEPGPRLPSWNCVPQNSPTMHLDNHFNPVSRAISKWRIGNLKKPPGFEKDWRFRFNLVNSLWSGR